MRVQLKPISEQVIVITGASSGIGLATARMAARRGAALVLVARDEPSIRELSDEITAGGGRATHVVADVTNPDDVRRISEAAVTRFGGFDTWVNNAGISVYGRLQDVPISEHRQIFETNYWGLVYGCMAAVEHLRTKGGAIINLGSVLSERAIPLQGTYSASKHAVKGFTDALRMELEHDGAPISVSLIKPTSIDTPYTHHAKNYLSTEPRNPAPVYAPDIVATAVLKCARYPIREVTVGGGGKMITLLGTALPRLMDKIMERVMFAAQHSDSPPRSREQHGLYDPSGRLQERGGHPGHVAETSLFTTASLHPLASAGILLGVAGLVAGSVLMAAPPRRRRSPIKRTLRRFHVG